MSILTWVIFGALIGFIADYIDSSTHLSWIERIIVGVVGAVVGGTIASFLTTGNLDITASAGFDVVSIVIAVIGALIAIFAWKKFRPSSL